MTDMLSVSIKIARRCSYLLYWTQVQRTDTLESFIKVILLNNSW